MALKEDRDKFMLAAVQKADKDWREQLEAGMEQDRTQELPATRGWREQLQELHEEAFEELRQESAALHEKITQLETIGIEQLAEIQRLTAELSRVREELAFAKSYIKGAEAQIARDEAELSRERERHQWIDVNQALPTDRKAVLVWCPERMNKYTACWTGETWHHFGGASNWCMNEEVTRWTPTPDPPASLEPKLPAPVVTPEEK